MAFPKGQPKPAGSGAKKGQTYGKAQLKQMLQECFEIHKSSIFQRIKELILSDDVKDFKYFLDLKVATEPKQVEHEGMVTLASILSNANPEELGIDERRNANTEVVES